VPRTKTPRIARIMPERISVAKSAFTDCKPTFAKIAVSAAKVAESSAQPAQAGIVMAISSRCREYSLSRSSNGSL
jgi:hypothetical protein